MSQPQRGSILQIRGLPAPLCSSHVFLSELAAEPAPPTFSARVEALPFPPDAREVVLDATFDGIRFTSGSSLGALLDFYRKGMVKRGWTEDKSAFESDEGDAEMTFQHDGAEAVIEFYVASDGVRVSIDCEGLDFSLANDPAALIAAGVPQPRSYLFLQKLPRPAEILDEEYSHDSCLFDCKLALPELFDFYAKAHPDGRLAGSAKPIITADRKYTEFTRGQEVVGVNVFTDEVGSRIVLDYESETKETVVPPLPDPHAALTKTTAGNDAPPTAAPEPVRIVDISKNKGTATITLEGKKYTLTHAAAYRSKQNGEKTVQLLFADKPIPFARLQELLLTEDDVDMSDLFESSWPGHIRISVGQYISFSFNSGGVGVGNSIDDPVNELKITEDRVTGTLKMREPIEVFDDKMFVETTIDAALLTPNTRVAK